MLQEGIETIRPGLGPQVQKAFLQNQSQFQLSPPQQQQQQQILAQVQGQGNMSNSSMYGGDMNSKDCQQNANDGSIAYQHAASTTIFFSATRSFTIRAEQPQKKGAFLFWYRD
ncbi:hypothetical protein F2Q68_00027230 [Brassica cretica]|uniref:Uncharacterized protein n=1 Tax=Brassica cretica TaxID=69181 RepID=A0A8S9IHE4_BRACR|nr:hypothetical protein F2Q68_00027230 [Brassica cretica]